MYSPLIFIEGVKWRDHMTIQLSLKKKKRAVLPILCGPCLLNKLFYWSQTNTKHKSSGLDDALSWCEHTVQPSLQSTEASPPSYNSLHVPDFFNIMFVRTIHVVGLLYCACHIVFHLWLCHNLFNYINGHLGGFH